MKCLKYILGGWLCGAAITAILACLLFVLKMILEVGAI